MALFDKDGNGVLDKAEMLAFKEHWKSTATKSGTAAAPSGADSAQNPGVHSTSVKQEGVVGAASGQGCGGPGGFCCCLCGCPKGGRCCCTRLFLIQSQRYICTFCCACLTLSFTSDLGERRAIERVELTLLRLESIVKEGGRDDDDAGASISLLQEDVDVVRGGGAATRMSLAGSGAKGTKRNSVAPL